MRVSPCFSFQHPIIHTRFAGAWTEPKATETWSSWLHNTSVMVILVCTVIDSCIILGLLSGKLTLGPSSTKALADLEIRSPYVNLDRLYKNASFPRTRHERIINHSRNFYQISSSKPNTVIPPYLDMRLSNIGMAPIYKRRLLLDSTVSKVIIARCIFLTPCTDLHNNPISCDGFRVRKLFPRNQHPTSERDHRDPFRIGRATND